MPTALSPLTPTASTPGRGPKADLRRSVRLLAAFRREQRDPDGFYGLLARDTTAQLAGHLDLEDQLVLDVGGGAGYFTRAFRAAGARGVLVEPNLTELRRGQWDAGVVAGDGYRLPIPDRTVDLAFSSNVLEHVSAPVPFVEELVRVTRVGGHVYVAYTNWLSPWGGHATSPWHYLGGHYAARRFERRTGRPPRHRYGTSLFPVSVAEMIRWARAHPHLDVIDARPRYLPDWCRSLVWLPGLREVATWNLALLLRRR
ncbi:MAG: class I SAM-dependent methyltransferase [Acidimicrobiales bacterium]